MKVGEVECTLWQWLTLRVLLPLLYFKSAERYVDDLVAGYRAWERAEFKKGRAARRRRRQMRRERRDAYQDSPKAG